MNAKQVLSKTYKSPFSGRKLARTQNSAFAIAENCNFWNCILGLVWAEYILKQVEKKGKVRSGHSCTKGPVLGPHCGSSRGWICPCLSSKCILKSNIWEAQFCNHLTSMSFCCHAFFSLVFKKPKSSEQWGVRKVLNSEDLGVACICSEHLLFVRKPHLYHGRQKQKIFYLFVH